MNRLILKAAVLGHKTEFQQNFNHQPGFKLVIKEHLQNKTGPWLHKARILISWSTLKFRRRLTLQSAEIMLLVKVLQLEDTFVVLLTASMTNQVLIYIAVFIFAKFVFIII